LKKRALKKKSRKRQQTRVVTIRVTELEYTIIKKKSQSTNTTISNFIRTAALGKELSSVIIVPEINHEAYTKLSRTNSNLNQLAHHLNSARAIGKPRSYNPDALIQMVNDLYMYTTETRNMLIGKCI